MKITNLNEAELYLEAFIPKTSKWGEPAMALARTKYFMKLLGDPQDQLKVIHIAGTSGKGSTAHMTAAALHSQGFKTGLGISPHLIHLLERIQIHTAPISEEMFVRYINEIQHHIEAMKTSQYGQATFFEIIVGLSYYIFYKEKVDVVVMETGLGGQYCATNTVTREDKISVITRIGYDHMEFLGDTLPLISNEKAKIIQSKNLALKLDQEKEVMDVFEKEAVEKNAQLLKVIPDQIISSRKSSLMGLRFDFSYKNIQWKELEISLVGEYQFENAAIALVTSIEYMHREKREVDENMLRMALKKIAIPGRMEMKSYKDREIVLDGAHNPQKMEAFIQSLIHIFPQEQFTFLISFKKGKDYEQILKYMVPYAEEFIITTFNNTNQGMGQLYSEDPNVLGDILKGMKFYGYSIVPDLADAFEKAQKSNKMIVVTGSLYLIGDMYHLMEK